MARRLLDAFDMTQTCHPDAPSTWRDGGLRCSVCGARRSPFGAQILELSGKPHELGGRAAMAGAVAIGLGGLLVASLIGGLLLVLAPASAAGWVVGVAVLVVTVVLAALIWRGGKRWERRGIARGAQARRSALLAAARARGGLLGAHEAGRLLGIDTADADAALMDLLRSGKVDIDLDDAGTVRYRVEPTRMQDTNVHTFAQEPDSILDDPHAVARQVRAPGRRT